MRGDWHAKFYPSEDVEYDETGNRVRRMGSKLRRAVGGVPFLGVHHEQYNKHRYTKDAWAQH